MIKLTYLLIVINIFAFAMCVLTFALTASFFSYFLAVVNLLMLFNTLRLLTEVEL